jgi:hypothetical protein
MSSMGKLMALALLCTLAAAVLFQPALMGPPRVRKRREPEPKDNVLDEPDEDDIPKPRRRARAREIA